MYDAAQRLAVPPGYDTIEGWLIRYDASPRILPVWPESSRICLVVCVVQQFETPKETEAMAYVVDSPEEASEYFLQGHRNMGCLFFQIPRYTLLHSEACPPGLTD